MAAVFIENISSVIVDCLFHFFVTSLAVLAYLIGSAVQAGLKTVGGKWKDGNVLSWSHG